MRVEERWQVWARGVRRVWLLTIPDGRWLLLDDWAFTNPHVLDYGPPGQGFRDQTYLSREEAIAAAIAEIKTEQRNIQAHLQALLAQASAEAS